MSAISLAKNGDIAEGVKPVFYRYPQSTEVNRIIPKNKLYEQAKVNSSIRELFVTQVEQITWSNKLSAQTLNIEANEKVTEIQIFKIVLKGEELALDVLQTIDKAIPHPIFFKIVSQNNKRKIVASYKVINIKGAVTLSDYYASAWQFDVDNGDGDGDGERNPLPLALNSKALYENLLAALLPYQLQEGEGFTELIKRIDVINKLKKQQVQINKRLRNEKQFKHKILINAELKKINKQLKQLISG